MFRALKYLAGVWSGAMVTAFCVAGALLYLMTGDLLVPRRGGARLLPVREISEELRALVERAQVQGHA